MDLYKYYASFSDNFANVALGEERAFSGKKSILDRIVSDCNRTGIRSFFISWQQIFIIIQEFSFLLMVNYMN